MEKKSTINEEWEKQQLELKKLSKGAESAPDYLRHLLHLFTIDFSLSMQKRLDIVFWNKLKSLIDGMKEASDGDRVVILNVHNLAIGFLTDLCLLVHENYEIMEMGIPEIYTWTLPGVPRRVVESRTKMKVFGAHFILRMGDLMRYKDNIPLAREYYKQSIRITPIDGSAWNQMGILASSSAQYLESAYFHTRAFHATMEFPSATGNLNAIFKKFANRDTSKPMPINELFLSVLSKIHFLLPIENSEIVLKKLGKETANSKEMVVSLMSVYQNLEGGTDLETRALEYVSTIWTTAYHHLLKKILDSPEPEIPEDPILHILALLHSASEFTEEFSKDAEEVGKRLLKSCGDFRDSESESEDLDDTLMDPEGFRYFQCCFGFENSGMQYPLTRGKLAEILMRKKGEKDEEEVFEKTSSESSPSKSTSSGDRKKVEKVVRREEDSDDSENEILTRGRRRGRAQQLDSNETDEEDF